MAETNPTPKAIILQLKIKILKCALLWGRTASLMWLAPLGPAQPLCPHTRCSAALGLTSFWREAAGGGAGQKGGVLSTQGLGSRLPHLQSEGAWQHNQHTAAAMLPQNSTSSGPPGFPCREGKGRHAGSDHY